MNPILIEGKVPRSILREPDIANAVLYKKDNRVFLIDTGATREMRKTLYQALESFRLFDSFILLNSHGHPDHTGNNRIIGEVSRYCHYLDGPRFPLSLITRPMKLLRLFGRVKDFFMDGKSLNNFNPFNTSPETAEYYEDTPARDLNGPLFQLLARFQQKDALTGGPGAG